MYTPETLTEIHLDSLVNIITSLCDSGVPEYRRDVKLVKAELARRGYRVRLKREPSPYRAGTFGRVAYLVQDTKGNSNEETR